MKTLGIIFIIAAVLLGIGAIKNSSPSTSSYEQLASNSADLAHSHNELNKDLNRYMVATGGRALNEIEPRHEDEMRAASASQRGEREQRLLFFAVSAGLLGITGLILVASQRQPAVTRARVPTALQSPSPPPRSGERLGATRAPIAPQPPPSLPPPPKVGRGIYLHMHGEVAGPYTTSEVEGYLESGRVTLQTLCCIEGTENWIAISDLAS